MPCRRLDQAIESLAPLARCLVGKRDRQNVVWIDPLFEQIRNPMDNHTGLARARPGQNQQRPIDGSDRFLLGWIEPLQGKRRQRSSGWRARKVYRRLRPGLLVFSDVNGHAAGLAPRLRQGGIDLTKPVLR